MAGSSKGITVVAKLLGGKAIETDSKEIKKSYEGIGEGARKADKDAEESGKGWSLFSAKAKQAAKDNEKTHRSFLKTASSHVGSMLSSGLGMVGIGGAAYGGYDAVKHAAEMNSIETATRSSLKSVGALHTGTMSKIDSAVTSSAMRGGFGQKQQLEGILQYAGETRSATEATKLNTAATSLARGAHLEYSQAQKMVAMGVTGSTGRLQKYLGIIMPVKTAVEAMSEAEKKANPLKLKAAELADKQATARKVQGIIEQKYGGATAAYNKTAAGQMSNLKNTVGLLDDKIGKALLPVLAKAATFFSKVATGAMKDWPAIEKVIKPVFKRIASGLKTVVGWVGHSKVALAALGVAIGGIVTVMVLYKAIQVGTTVVMALKTVVTTGVTAATWLYNAATFAATFATTGLGVAMIAATGGLVLIGIGIYALITHFKLFKRIVTDVWDWIKGHWHLLAGILLGPIAFAVIEIATHWSSFVGFFKAVPGKLAAAGKGMWNFVKTEFKSAIDWILHGWNKLHFKMPGVHTPFGNIGGFNIGLPQIPLLAEGGTARTAGLSIVGDRGPELLSLPVGARIDPLLPGGRGPTSAPGTWHGSGGDLTVICQLDRKEIARAVVGEFNREAARR
jgi:hypothetical protein